jgi:phosphoglycerate-specific signal transduction histidine kinase
MATKKNTEALDFDLAVFKKQKEQLARVASTEVANKVTEIKILIDQIKELVSLSGITLNLKDELAYAIECVDELHPDWNSSSYDC